jgi:hypothetical protein
MYVSYALLHGQFMNHEDHGVLIFPHCLIAHRSIDLIKYGYLFPNVTMTMMNWRRWF